MAQAWFVQKNGQQTGPFTPEQLKGQALSGQLLQTDHGWTEGQANWVQAGSLPGLFAQAAPTAPQPSGISTQTTPYPQQNSQNIPAQPFPQPGYPQQGYPQQGYAAPKSRLVYILLGLFLGTLGIHNFYAKRNTQGIIQLLITLLTAGFGAIATAIWAIIDIIQVKEDGDGVPFT